MENKKNIKLFKFGKHNSLKDLENYVKKSEIVFHLAGENRNKIQNKFINNNFKLTRDLVNLIKKKSKKTHLIFSSTKQIESKKNIYTRTKLDAENYLKKNVGKNYQLKFIDYKYFGKWANQIITRLLQHLAIEFLEIKN